MQCCFNCTKLKLINGKNKCTEEEVQNIKRQDLLFIDDIFNTICEYYNESITM